jgi:putative intracellular protease/amidase
MTGNSKRIGILMFGDVEELDAIGPWEVLSYWTRRWPDNGWQVFTFSRAGGDVKCAKELTVRVDHSDADRPVLDVLIYPGGQGTRRHLEDGAGSTGCGSVATRALS